MTMFRHTRYLCVLSMIVVSCSEVTDANSVKSLDAFSGGFSSASLRCSAKAVDVSNVTQHAYWQNFRDKVLPASALPETRREDLKKKVVVALTAVPEPLVRLFMNNSDIRITPDAGKICAVNNQDGHGQFQGVAGCIVAITENKRMTLSIVADATDAAIGSTIVRSFGYWVSQYLSSLYQADGAMYKTTELNLDFRQNQRSVARHYFADVLDKRLFKLSHFADLIGTGGGKTIGTNIAAGAADPLQGVTFNVPAGQLEERLQRRSRFESYIFAEAFDSYFCNDYAIHPDQQQYTASGLKETLRNLKNTKLVFRDMFPETFKSFRGVISGVVQDVETFLRVQNLSSVKTGLWLGVGDASPQPMAGDSTGSNTGTLPTTPVITGNPLAETAAVQPPLVPLVTSQPASHPVGAQPAKPPVNVQSDAVTVIIDAQGQNISSENIQVIKPVGGLNQDVNIEIINQALGNEVSGTVVDVGGVQTGGPALDSSIVTPVAVPVLQSEADSGPDIQGVPVTVAPSAGEASGPVADESGAGTTEGSISAGINSTGENASTGASPGHQVQSVVPHFPPQTGQMSQSEFTHVTSWNGYGGGNFGGYGGCH